MKKIKIITCLIIGCFILVGISPVASCLSADDIKKETINDTNIESSNSGDVSAHAKFDWLPKYPDPGEEVNFYSTSTAFSGHIYYYKWVFHDGITIKNSKATFTYDEKGSYKVKLEIRARGYDTQEGRSAYDYDSITKYIKIGASPFPIFQLEPSNPSPGEKVIFNASTSYDINGEIINYNWSIYNIEDPGNIIYLDSQKITNYTWDIQGVFNISLFVEDDNGYNNTLTKTVPVSILKIGDITTYQKNINFSISNHGETIAENTTWTFDINKYNIFDRPRNIYQKNNTNISLEPFNYENITIDDFNRIFCKVKIIITAEADNAVKVQKSTYGLVRGKNIYLVDGNFGNPYESVLCMIILGGLFLLYSSLILRALKSV